MSARSDRRGFLRGLATLPLIGRGVALSGLPAAAAPAVAAAEQELGDRAVAAYLRFDRLIDARCGIEDAIGDALRPLRDALEVRDDDPWSFNRPHNVEYDGKRRYRSAHLQILRRVRNLSPAHEERRQELVAALERYGAEKARLRNSLGFQEAKRVESEAEAASDALFDEIVETPATTLAGIIAKARAVKAIYHEAEPGEDSGTTDTRIAMSIVRDLLALDSAA